MTCARRAAAAAMLLLTWPASGAAQTFEGPGARAQGMAAFVAVADDATAVYWNPAGLASGAYFSLVIDRTDAEAAPADESRAGGRSSWFIGLGTPALGLSYYRLRNTLVEPAPGLSAGPRSRVESLVTHHTGATLVQSITERLAVGATVKLVRGVATVGEAPVAAANLLDDWEQMGVAGNAFDVDVGAMLAGRFLRAGVVLRNATQPSFDAGSGREIQLDRQARAGLALLVSERWTAALDLDLTTNRGPFGDIRALALGTEGRLTPRASARAGLQVNLAEDQERAPALSLGASYAVLGSLLVDAHFSTGADRAFEGWGIAGRIGF